MNLSPRVRRGLIGVGVLVALVALLTAAVVWLPSVVARQLTLHYLERAGVTARIGDVDVDLLSGTLVVEDAQGHGPDGDGFSIGRLSLSLDYAPLWSKRLSLSRLALDDTAIDVRRGAANDLRIGGITVARGGRERSSPPDWGLALHKLTLHGLRIHYSQPANGQQPAIDRELVFNDSSARDVVTWQKDNDTSLDADMRVGDSRIRLKGQITPFGKTVSGHFDLQTDNFSLELLSPLTRPGDVQRLTGTVDSDQQIDIRYDPAKALSVTIDGSADWQGSKMALARQLTLSGERFKWQGRLALELLRADGAPATLDSDGRLQVTKLALAGPGSLRLSQTGGDWQGQAGVTLGAAGMQLHTDGKLDSQGLDVRAGANSRMQTPRLHWNGVAKTEPGEAGQNRVTADGQFAATRLQARITNTNHIDARGVNWQGSLQALTGSQLSIEGDGTLKADDLDMTIAGNSRVNGRGLRWQGKIKSVVKAGAQVNSNGSLKARELKLKVPGSLDLEAAPLAWQGSIDVNKQHTTHIHSDGRLDTGAVTFAVPDTAIFKTRDALWKGALDFDIGALLARKASGRLITNHARLDLPGQPVALSSDRVVFNGDYGQQPAAGHALKLRLSGDVASQKFALTDTTIDAPWAALRDVEVHNLAIDGVERIGFDTLIAQGVRLLGDTDTSAAVVDAITATARGFQLDDLRRYRVSDLDFDDANIHLRRDAQGMGVMALYFGGDKNDPPVAKTKPAQTPSTYAIDHLSLSAPLLAFNDVAVTPAVSLQGAELEFSLDDLDTGSRERVASYRLSLDVGRYGHFDSIGKIAPLASGGMNMDIDAWMRSLALAPLSGYLNAAVGRRIARGVADGTLNLKAGNGQLKGNLDTTLSNFRLVDDPDANTDIVLGISMDTALDMVRRDSDNIRFETTILGDVGNPYFSIRNLVREAVLAGLRSTVLSDYSPLGLLNNVKNALFDLGRPLASKPVVFPAGRHYIRTQDRDYLSRIAQSMRRKPKLRLVIQGHATPQDADAMAGFVANLGNSAQSLTTLAEQRATAVRDYLAARDVNPDRLSLAKPKIENSDNTQPRVTFDLCKHE